MAEEKKKLIQFKNIVKSFEDGQVVLKGVSLDIYENEFVTLLGPSGCGKTTLLRILGGFLQPSEGKVLFDGEDIVSVPPYKREINTVFQKYALFPHMDVYDNIAFGLTLKKEPKDVIEQKVMRMLRLVSLEDYAHRNVTELSGGQQQRIAIARALVNEPSVLLLDEPLGALDLKLRKEMQQELKYIQQEVGITFIFVTHDQEEALTMSDKIVVMNAGEIQQIGTPTEIYRTPVNELRTTSSCSRTRSTPAVPAATIRTKRSTSSSAPSTSTLSRVPRVCSRARSSLSFSRACTMKPWSKRASVRPSP